jgi:predicted acylesterase/phospholipase RssA
MRLQPSQVKNLVFSGGGVRGYSYVGVLLALQGAGVSLSQLHGCGGTSIGALIATLVCLGFTPAELVEELLSVHARDIIDFNLTCFLSRFGLNDGSKLRHYVEGLVVRKYPESRGQLTFCQLQEEGNKRLVIVACDLNNNAELVLSPETTPDMPVALACHMSMAVPVLFAPVPWRRGAMMNGEDETVLVVDGGLKNNFPMRYFPAHTTLGLRVTWPAASSLQSIDQVLARAIYCILTDAEEVQWQQLGEQQRLNTIHVEVGDLSTIELYLTEAHKRSIMQFGEVAVQRHFAAIACQSQVGALLLAQLVHTHTHTHAPQEKFT